MSILLSKYRVISLGFNCYCKGYIDEYLKSSPYNIFDFIGTSVWSITELLKNNFDGLLSRENIHRININTNELPMYTNVKYYVRFTHDNFDENMVNVENTIKKLQRRINRFNEEIKNNSNTIIFLRLEENNKYRIEHPQYFEKTRQTEYDQLIELSTYIKLNINNNFKIIYLSSNPTNYDKENNIICINADTTKFFWQTCGKLFNSTLTENKDFLKNCLEN